MIRRSGMLNRAGDLAVLSEIQQRVLAETVEPNSAPGVAIADAHRDQPNMRGTTAGVEGSRDDLANNRDGNRAHRIRLAVFAGEDNLRTAADGTRTRRHQPQVRSGSRVRIATQGKRGKNRGRDKLAKSGAHRCPHAEKLPLKSKNTTQGQIDIPTFTRFEVWCDPQASLQ